MQEIKKPQDVLVKGVAVRILREEQWSLSLSVETLKLSIVVSFGKYCTVNDIKNEETVIELLVK